MHCPYLFLLMSLAYGTSLSQKRNWVKMGHKCTIEKNQGTAQWSKYSAGVNIASFGALVSTFGSRAVFVRPN